MARAFLYSISLNSGLVTGTSFDELDAADIPDLSAVYQTVGGGGSYTDEDAQDAIGTVSVSTATVNVTYTDATPELKWDVRTQMSVTFDASGVKLSGDSATPGNSKMYGTDGSGVKGWYTQPGAGSTYTADETTLHLAGTVFEIKSTYVGQTSITTLGTVTTGVWNGTPVPVLYGGTGQATPAAARGSFGLNVESATGHGDSSFGMMATDRFVHTTAALTAPRAWTLPAASAVNPGGTIVIADLAGGVTSTNTLTVSPTGADTLPPTVISAAFGSAVLTSDGTSAWHARVIQGTATGTNTGDVTLAGETYLSIAGQVVTANPVNLSGSHATGTLAAGRFPALTGDVTTVAGALATTIAAGAVTLAKQANMATASVVYRKTAGSGAPEVQTIATLKTDLGLTGTNSGDQTSVTGNAGTATALQTARAIYGNNFDGTAALTQIIASTFGGTGNGFTKFSGPATAEKTFTLPNASATVLTSNAAVTVGQGGSGADLSATGGANQLVRQNSAGGAFTVSALAVADFPTLTGLTDADPAAADTVTGYDASATANRKFQVDRVLGLARVSPGGRLTLTSGTPVTTADVSAATNVFYTPYTSDVVVLWDGTRWVQSVFAETTLALGTVTSGLPYDVFGYLNSGTFTLEKLAWTNTTTRATGISLQDGRYCKTGDKTRLYLGTVYTTSTTTTEDSITKRFVWNMYNRCHRPLYKALSGSWTYNSGTIRQCNATASYQVEAVIGLAGAAVSLQFSLLVVAAGGGSRAYIGDNSTSAAAAACIPVQIGGTGNASCTAGLTAAPAVGYHAFTCLEAADTNNSHFGSVAAIGGWVEG